MKFSYRSGAKPLDGYTIKRGIGIGGFGEVYFALSEAGKEVALKKIQRNLDIELRGVRQCLNLKHVNLITLWDIRINEAGESWVVMEYVPGPSLRDIVEEHPDGMLEEDIKTWFVSTASGCSYLHEHGIVHRDLKPANIFCDEDEQIIKIGDYGLSKFISYSKRSGHTESVGTFHYMAPEIGKGVYGKEIDIYALGILLFEMLTGDVPFNGESAQEIMMKHLTADPDLTPVPYGYRAVIAKSLRKDPILRYDNVPAMLADMPWPEIAANSQNIVSQHSVGPMKPGPNSRSHVSIQSTHHHVSSQTEVVDAIEVASGAQLPPAILDMKEVQVVSQEIVFGKLKDTSQAGVHEVSNAGQPAIAADQDQPGQDPIQVITSSHPFSSADAASSSHLSDGAPTQRVIVPANRVVSASDAKGGNEPVSLLVPSSFARSSFARSSFDRVTQWWYNTKISTPLKVIGLIVAGVVVIKNSQWLLPLAMGLAVIYALYYGVVHWFKPKILKRRELKQQTVSRLRHWVAQRPVSDRVTDLLGSLLVGAFACLVLNLLGLAIGGPAVSGSIPNSDFDATIDSWGLYAWLATTSVVGCWSLLLIGKVWEHESGENSLRRLTMLAIGLLVGGVAFFSAGIFGVDLTEASLVRFGTRESKLAITGLPMLAAYLIFFVGLFGILRWWMQADPVRTTRLSIVRVGWCLIWATIFSDILQVPMIPNCILAVVISVSVQLAAPWITHSQREQIFESSE